jgi:hypothetical protein
VRPSVDDAVALSADPAPKAWHDVALTRAMRRLKDEWEAVGEEGRKGLAG